MLLDPFLSKVLDQCNEGRLLQALRSLYQDIEWPEHEVLPELGKWRRKGTKRPGLAISTGRRNSFAGMVTCALLQNLGVDRPKAERNRLTLAWAILGSTEARRIIGHVPELEAARAVWEALQPRPRDPGDG